MVYRTYIPRPPLSDFVELFWLYEGYDLPHAKERVLPTGTTELVINLHEDALRIYDGRAGYRPVPGLSRFLDLRRAL